MLKFLIELKDLIVLDYGLVVFLFAAVVTLLVGCFTSFITTYTALGLNSQIFAFSGVFLGLILTAYAIFVTLLPVTAKKVVKTEAFTRINTAFIFELLATIIMIVVSLLLFFLNQIVILSAIIYFQFWLLLVIILWALLLVMFLHALFDNIRSYKIDPNPPL